MSQPSPRLIIPALGPVYNNTHDWAYLLLRVVAGICLMVHGWPKIQNPMGAINMVQNLGFYPGALFSPLLAITEFFGGLLIAVGLLTRPAALGATFVLLVTVWFHWVTKGEGFGGAEKSILWAAMTFFILIAGPGRFSVDRAIGKSF